MSKSLAMLTYESLGAVEFKSLVEKLNDGQISDLFGDSEYVHSVDMYKSGAVYVVIGAGTREDRPGWVDVFDSEYNFYYYKHRMDRDFDFLCLGNRSKGVDVSTLETGTRVEIYTNDGRVQIGVGFKSSSGLWIITGLERKLTDDGLVGMIDDSAEDVTYRFFDVDGEGIEL